MPLHLRFGPMFSGKSQELKRSLTTYADTGFKVLLVTSSADTRPGVRGFSTHSSSGGDLSELITCQTVSLLSQVDVSGFDVVGVDEGQFFSDLLQAVPSWLNLGKVIFVAGLDGDFRRRRFGDILDLIPLADTAVKLCAVCMECCRSRKPGDPVSPVPAPYSAKISGTTDVVQVGGKDLYVPVCQAHYLSLNP